MLDSVLGSAKRCRELPIGFISRSESMPMRSSLVPQSLKRRMLLEDLQRNEVRDEAFRRIIHSIPRGRVSSYGSVAMAAGYPLHHRAVAHLLRRETLTNLPWQRILGADGEIRLKGEFADEQRLRLKMEGVRFDGHRLNMALYEHVFDCGIY
jgi:methylated-DNA-protein-cysteine methyltransferase related protein